MFHVDFKAMDIMFDDRSLMNQRIKRENTDGLGTWIVSYVVDADKTLPFEPKKIDKMTIFFLEKSPRGVLI